MSDSSQTSDQVVRRQVLDPAQSWIVQAPAGSGKTGLLIQRYLVLLGCASEPEEIIAITFTRKASAEMRERVLQALAKAGQPATNEFEQLTGELAAAVLRRDAERGWGIVMNPSRLRIQTIDSLCASLVRQMPVVSRFGSPLQTTDDAGNLYLEAAQATIGQISSNGAVAQDVRQLLVYLDNDIARIEILLVDMLSHRNHWLRHLYARDRNKLEAGRVHLRQEVSGALHHRMSQWPAALREELVAIAPYAAASMAVNNPASSIAACGMMTGIPGSKEKDVIVWQGIATMLLSQKGEWRKKHTTDNGFPVGHDKSGKEIAQSWRKRVEALIAAISAGDEFRQWLHETRSLPPAAYTDAQWQILEAMLRLLRHAVAELKLVFRSHGMVDHTEIAQAALHALGDADAPTDLALSLDYGIRHLLIDEFQDTSVSQYELIRKLTAGWEPGDGRTMFVVGDPMQSVYRFREAEVGLFLHARAAGIGHIRLQPVSLSANFRSQRGIVDWVNTVFSTIMPVAEDTATGAVPYSHSVAVHEALGGDAVSIHPFYRKNDPAEAATVTGLIRQIRLTGPQDTVAVLVRSRTHLNDIVPLLREAGLRFRALEIESLWQRQIVQDLFALTRALIHVSDRTAWLALLRAPWCGLLLADIHALIMMGASARNKETVDRCGKTGAGAAHSEEGGHPTESARNSTVSERTVWELINDGQCASMVSPDGYRRLLFLRKVMGECLRHRFRQPLRMTVEAAWRVLGGEACLDSVAEQEDAAAYFGYLESHETAGSVIDLSAFERGLTKLYARPDPLADDTLQVMTIHKAKGLEFDHVIIPGLSRQPGLTTKKLLAWMERPRLGFAADSQHDRFEADLLLAPLEETGASKDLTYAWLGKLEDKKEHLESERLLYVAATRAKQRLHLLGSLEMVTDHDGNTGVRPPPARSLLARLWPVASVEEQYCLSPGACGAPVPDNQGNDKKTDGVQEIQSDWLLRRLVPGWTLPAPLPDVAWQGPREKVWRQDEVEFSWAGETARVTGVIVHRWLQMIARSAMKDWNPSRIEALRSVFGHQLEASGVRNDEIGIATGKVIAALVHCVSDQRGQWLLGPQQEAENELRLTAMVAGVCTSLAIDRTFRDVDGCYWVIDYKTSSHSGAGVEVFLDREQQRYRAQLDRYAAVMRMTGKSPVKCGLYFPLLRGWREWHDDDPDDQ